MLYIWVTVHIWNCQHFELLNAAFFVDGIKTKHLFYLIELKQCQLCWKSHWIYWVLNVTEMLISLLSYKHIFLLFKSHLYSNFSLAYDPPPPLLCSNELILTQRTQTTCRGREEFLMGGTGWSLAPGRISVQAWLHNWYLISFVLLSERQSNKAVLFYCQKDRAIRVILLSQVYRPAP